MISFFHGGKLKRPARHKNKITALLLLALLACFGACKYDPPVRPPDRVTVINSGVASNNTYDLLGRINTSVIAKAPGLVVIMIGTNDAFNTANHIPLRQYERNLQQIVSLIKVHGAEVLLLSPPPVGKNTIGDPVLLNAKIDTIVNIMRSCSVKDSCFFFDINKAIKDQGSPTNKASSLIANLANSSRDDGVHLTNKGCEFVARSVYGFLKAKGVDYTMIVCFGDSITNGVTLAGAGTATGDTYPAVLSRLLNNR